MIKAFLATVFLLPVILQAESTQTASILLNLSPTELVSKKGSAVQFKVTITNNSKSDFSFHAKNPACDYGFDVRTSKGSLVPETEYKREFDCKSGINSRRWIVMKLKPNESWSEEIVVTSLYDLTHAGKYLVQIERPVPESAGSNPLKSNIATIEITD
jgi:hypothetical protein